MGKILLTLVTLLCFTGCASMQSYQDPPAAAQEAPAETSGSGTNVWIVLGVLAALAAVIVLTNDDGGGGGGGGY